MKHLYWFAFYNLNSPTVRYRGKYTTDYLREHHGVNCKIILPAHNWKTIIQFLKAYIRVLLFPRPGTLIVIQSVYRKSLYPFLLKCLIRIRRKVTFYDMDDADYLRYAPENIYYFIKHAAVVTLGSTELVKNLHHRNLHCTLITCPVPDLNITKQTRNEVFTIGWIGEFQKTHKQSLLNSFFPSLFQLRFPVKLVLLGVVNDEERIFLKSYFMPYSHVQLVMPYPVPWNDELYIQHQIMQFDVGIATLLDDEFSRSKSAFKLKQCFNNGVPVLSTNLPENNRFLIEGVNGYFCDSPEEFRQRIIEFKQMDAVTYSGFSTNARKATLNFNLEHFSRELIKTYQQHSLHHSK